MNRAVFLWSRRIKAWMSRIFEALKLIVDIWVALYIIIPFMAIVVWIYRDLLIALPAWFHPEFSILLLSLLGLLMVSGRLRTYLKEADLVFLFSSPGQFRRLFRLGVFTNLFIHGLIILIFTILLYPFYFHLRGASFLSWIGISVWVVGLRMIFLHSTFPLQGRLARHLARALFLAVFINLWLKLVDPFLLSPDFISLLDIMGSVFVLFSLSVVLRWRLPVLNWEEIVARETAFDTRIMGMLLGHAAKPVRKRSGRSRLSPRRLGIPFTKDYALPYFYTKYLLREKQGLWVYLQIIAVCIVMFTAPLVVATVFWAVANLMIALLVRSIINDGLEKAATLIPNLQSKNSKAVNLLYAIFMAPLCLFPMFMSLITSEAFAHVLTGSTIMLVSTVATVFLLTRWSPHYLRRLIRFTPD